MNRRPPPPLSLSKMEPIERYQKHAIEKLFTIEEFKECLASCEEPQIRAFFMDLCNPKYARISIIALMERHQLPMLAVQEMWRNYSLARAMQIFCGGMRIIAADIVEDAKNKTVECGLCAGLGEILGKKGHYRKCPRCKGTGEQVQPGDADARRMILESIGWTGKKSLIQQNFYTAPGIHDALEEMEQMERKQLEPPKAPVIDVETVEVGETKQ